jgi:hypothetical protein
VHCAAESEKRIVSQKREEEAKQSDKGDRRAEIEQEGEKEFPALIPPRTCDSTSQKISVRTIQFLKRRRREGKGQDKAKSRTKQNLVV